MTSSDTQLIVQLLTIVTFIIVSVIVTLQNRKNEKALLELALSLAKRVNYLNSLMDKNSMSIFNKTNKYGHKTFISGYRNEDFEWINSIYKSKTKKYKYIQARYSS